MPQMVKVMSLRTDFLIKKNVANDASDYLWYMTK